MGIRSLTDVVWRNVNNVFAKQWDLQTDLEWFEKQISVKGISSSSYFEKYIIVSVDTAKLKEFVATGTGFEQNLQPKTLFSFPHKNEENGLPSLFDDEQCEQIADFCFPNGV